MNPNSSMRTARSWALLIVAMLLAVGVAACQEEEPQKNRSSGGTAACSSDPHEMVDEGSLTSPVAVQLNRSQCATIGTWGLSYYRFTAENNVSHRISLTQVDSDLSWGMGLAQPPHQFVAACDNYWSTADESCQTPLLDGGVAYIIEVMEWDYEPNAFWIKVADE